MKTLTENEHPLVTPNFVGTDAEKITVLNYWSDLIRLVRSMNTLVISYDNKLAIVNQLQAELNIINSEINNVTSHLIKHADGSEEMSTMPKAIVNLAEPEAPAVPSNVPMVAADRFNPKNIPTSEAMQRLAGTYYANNMQKKKKTSFKK